MKKLILCIFLLFIPLALFSLDIFVNDEYWKSYSSEELELLYEGNPLPLWYLSPLMESVFSMRTNSGQNSSEWDEAEFERLFYQISLEKRMDGTWILNHQGNIHSHPERISLY